MNSTVSPGDLLVAKREHYLRKCTSGHFSYEKGDCFLVLGDTKEQINCLDLLAMKYGVVVLWYHTGNLSGYMNLFSFFELKKI